MPAISLNLLCNRFQYSHQPRQEQGCHSASIAASTGVSNPRIQTNFSRLPGYYNPGGLSMKNAVCAVGGDGNDSSADATPAAQPSADHEDSKPKIAGQQQGSLSAVEILKQLRRYGISGVLSYGLLNTAYYLTTFLLVWFYFTPAPARMGYLATVERFVKIMAMVWAGSQVTKLLRAGGALALAPLVDRGLSWFAVRYKFESRGKAFFAIVGWCVGVALVLFFVVTLLSA
ncbi:hypothetical protein AKJ16_DCAP11792 [Drosera capensis]